MTDPIAFSTATAKFGLPYLFAGQSQKEFTVNEAHARMDVLLHPVVEGFTNSPPPVPRNGEAWIVSSEALAEWAGREDAIAAFSDGRWLFIEPSQPMLIFDRSAGQYVSYNEGWSAPADVVAPTGGANIDVEARNAIEQIIDALRRIGVFSAL